MAMGVLGEVDDLTAVAEQALRRATTSFQASHMRFWFGAVYGRACRLTGRIDEFVSTAKQLADSSRDVPGLAYANLALLSGNAELVRGAAAEAARLVHEALAGVQRHSVRTGLRPASYFALAEAHAKLGHPAEANEAVAEARSCVPADYLFMHTGLSLASGWAMAASGRLSEAAASVQEAARLARDRGQPTHELACIQAAAQWGDASGAARARELADALSLPLADAVAAHAEALLAGDGEGLLAAAVQYRGIGDRAAAADAAAQASAAFALSQQHRRELYAAALAKELAEECGGLCTPALRTPAGLKLSGRQRDVIELVVAGLSNRQIADQLVMSVRTVEGHIYRACQRVGAQSREELASIIRSGPGVDGVAELRIRTNQSRRYRASKHLRTKELAWSGRWKKRDIGALPIAPKNPLPFWQQVKAVRSYIEGHQTLLNAGGPITRLVLGPKWLVPNVVMIASPQGARDLLGRNDGVADRGRAKTMVEMRALMGGNLLNLPHQRWLPRRRALQPMFTKQQVPRYAGHMATAAEELVDVWRDGAFVDLDSECRKLTLQALGRSVLGLDLGDRAEEVGGALRAALVWVADRGTRPVNPPRWLPTRGQRAARRANRTLHRAGRRNPARGSHKPRPRRPAGARPDPGDRSGDRSAVARR